MTASEINRYLLMQNKIRHVTYRYELLNQNDGFLDHISIQNASVSNNIFRDIKRLANFELDEYHQRNINFLTERIKPYFVLRLPNNQKAEWPLGVFLLSSPTQRIRGKQKTRTISAYDKTLILKDDKLSQPLYIPRGKRYTDALKQILQDAAISKYRIIKSDIEINTDREFQIGLSIGEVINTLLKEINYNLVYVDEDGWFILEPYVLPEDRQIQHKYASGEYSVILQEMETELDLLDRANVFIAWSVDTESNRILQAKAVNDNPSSILSTVNRGREIVKVVEIENAPSQSVLDLKARQMLAEESTAYNHFVFSTINIPTHQYGENLYIDLPILSDVPLVFNETAWEIKTDGDMRHEARRLVRL